MEKYQIMIQKHLKKLDEKIENFVKSGKNLRNIALVGVVFAVIITVKIINAIFGQTYGSATIYGKTYKTIVIGNKTWMAENLNHETRFSKCYNNEFQNCYKYGRLYNWYTAQKICPEGWHLPANNEWDGFFATLLGGIGVPYPTGDSTIGAKYYNIDHSGYWWTSTNYDMENAIARNIYANEERIKWDKFDKLGLFSVRCIKN
ncbi:MAG: hypothetical protein FWF63_11085 [Fibromonadales bacterium]|nr:hypothetical protein [Fibromonadales bacterium]